MTTQNHVTITLPPENEFHSPYSLTSKNSNFIYKHLKIMNTCIPTQKIILDILEASNHQKNSFSSDSRPDRNSAHIFNNMNFSTSITSTTWFMFPNSHSCMGKHDSCSPMTIGKLGSITPRISSSQNLQQQPNNNKLYTIILLTTQGVFWTWLLALNPSLYHIPSQ